MTSHELARLLLSMPDRLAVNDRGEPIRSADDAHAGVLRHDGNGPVFGYAFHDASDGTELQTRWLAKLQSVRVVRISVDS